MRSFRYTFSFAVMGYAAAAFAQIAQPYSWNVTAEEKTARPGEIVHLRATASIQEGWHIYSTKSYGADGPLPTQFSLGETKYFTIGGPVKYPKPLQKRDEAFQLTTEFFEHSVTFTMPVRVAQTIPAGKTSIPLSITAMACNDRMCMPPKSYRFAIPVHITAAGATGAAATPPAPSGTIAGNGEKTAGTAVSGAAQPAAEHPPAPAAPQTEEFDLLTAKGFWWFIGFAFSMGLLSLLTPCVFPMIPLTVSFFTKRGTTSRGEAMREAGLYGLGIVGTYTAAGLLFALIFGASSLANLAANPVVNLVFASIFLLLALNLFGVYEIAIPARMLNSINAFAGNGTNAGALFLMGLTFTVTSFTCTVPFVGTVMVAAAHGHFLLPFAGMLAYSAAFAAPFVLLALFPHALQKLPHSGEWMNSVKVVMGFLELAAVVKFLSNSDLVWQWKMITRDVFLSTWIAISLLLVLYLLGILRMHGESAEPRRIGTGRLLLSVFFLTLALVFYTGLKGTPLGTLDAYLPPRDYGAGAQPLIGAAQAAQAQPAERSGGYEWLDDYNAALARARKESKNVFIDFTGYTCTNCRWMESNIFSVPQVDSLLRQFILVKLYTDGDGAMYESNQRFEESRFGTIALPLYAVMTPADKPVAVFSKGMTRDAAEFEQFLQSGLPRTLAVK